MGIRVQVLIVAAVAVLAGLVWYGDFWFEQTFGEPDVEVTSPPTSLPTSGQAQAILIPTTTPIPIDGSSDLPILVTLVPTTLPVSTPASPPTSGQADPTLTLAPSPTASFTPSPSEGSLPQTVQVTASFIKYALCPSEQVAAAQALIQTTETQLTPIQTTYDECKALAEAETQACVDVCVALNCLLACESEAAPKFQACDDDYYAAYNPVVDAAVSELDQLCTTVVR